jgi:acyl carrier protein
VAIITGESIEDRVRQLLREQGTLTADPDSLTQDDDLYEAGLTSLSAVDLMLALEQEFDFLVPDDSLNRRTFASIGSIAAMVQRVTSGPTG